MDVTKSISYEGQKKTDTLDGKLRIEEGNGRLIVSDGTNNIGVFGYDAAGKVVVKIAKPGFNADTTTDEHLIFNSNQNVFKIVATGTSNTSGAARNSGSGYFSGQNNVTVAHNLGFVPIAVGALDAGGTFYMLPTQTLTTSSGSPGFFYQEFYRLAADATNLFISTIYFGFNLGGGNTTNWPVKYYLLQETAS